MTWINRTGSGTLGKAVMADAPAPIEGKNKELIDEFIAKMRSDNLNARHCAQTQRFLEGFARSVPDMANVGEKEIVAHINRLKQDGYNHHWVFQRKIVGADGQVTYRDEHARRGGKYSIATIASNKIALKTFYTWLNKGVKPDFIKTMKIETTSGNLGPDDVLKLDEIAKMAAAAISQRDRALIWVLYETGGRIGEFLDMRRGDIEFDGTGARVRLRTLKTRQTNRPTRTTRIYHGATDLAAWLNALRDKSKDAYVWVKLAQTNGEPVDAYTTRRILRDLVVRAGIDRKPGEVHPHLLRHSRASELGRTLTEGDLRLYFGWSKTSNMPSHYCHRSEDAVDNSILEMYGIKPPEAETGIIECARCHRKNPKAEFCLGCGFPLASEAARESMEDTKNLIALGKAMRILKQDEDFRAIVDKLMSKI